MRTLILMRHAKSDYPGGVSDHDRPLATRGRAEATLAGDWIREHQPAVDLVLTSSALRADETADHLGLPAPRRQEPTIYDAWPDLVLQSIQQVDPSVGTLLVVGHAPGIPGLIVDLASATSDGPALQQVQQRYPTSAIAVLETDAEWDDLMTAGATLRTVHIPRA